MRNMEKVLSARTDMREKCLLWGLPGIVICTISLLVSLKVGYSFGQSSFVECITFAVCTALLFLLYWLIFQTLPQDLCNIIVSHWQKQTEQTYGISDIAEESKSKRNCSCLTWLIFILVRSRKIADKRLKSRLRIRFQSFKMRHPYQKAPCQSMTDAGLSIANSRNGKERKCSNVSTPIFLKPCPRSVIWKQSPLFRKMSWNGPMTRTMSREQYP